MHVRSKSWETRISACHAIEEIAKNTPLWNPPTIQDARDDFLTSLDDEGLLTFEKFDINTVLKHGVFLVGSEGQEFDADFGALDPKERMILLKKQVKQKLGLGTEFMDMDFFNESDIIEIKDVKVERNQKKAQVLLNELSGLKEDSMMEGLSARERNKMKRKLKLEKSKKESISHIPQLTASSTKKRKMISEEEIILSDEDVKIEPQPALSEKPVEKKGETKSEFEVYATSEEWPFEALCETLSLELFSPKWEIRHGAALALSKVLLLQGSGAGKIVNASKQTQERLHIQWQNDLAIRYIEYFCIV